ncbi:hypothetical protein KIL84_014100 [Mauremys mutica]|uniref:Uncharacterized protein n=1 Tax=Mauremys mutica TaxID=74926 RepID=A0A9D3XMS8_9SAUR|nr:hypothetical protein KIL84_014100 [Mauremys mutica]
MCAMTHKEAAHFPGMLRTLTWVIQCVSTLSTFPTHLLHSTCSPESYLMLCDPAPQLLYGSAAHPWAGEEPEDCNSRGQSKDSCSCLGRSVETPSPSMPTLSLPPPTEQPTGRLL